MEKSHSNGSGDNFESGCVFTSDSSCVDWLGVMTLKMDIQVHFVTFSVMDSYVLYVGSIYAFVL